MPAIAAEEVLAARGGSLPAETLRKLTLVATGDAEEAEAAWLRKVEADMEAGRKPEL